MKPRFAAVLIAGVTLFVTAGAHGEGFRLTPLLSIHQDEKNVLMKSPEGVACGEKNQIVIADTGNGRLLRYQVGDDGVSGGTEIKVPQLPSPIRVQIAATGEIFALDGKLRKIARFGADGGFLGYLEVKGGGDGTVIPRSFRVDAGGIYVLDLFGERVLLLDQEGNVKRQIPFPAGHGSCSDVAVDGKGSIFLLDSTRALIYSAPKDGTAFTPFGKQLHEYVAFPTSFAVDSRGMIYLADRNNGIIALVGADGAYQGRQLGQGQRPGFLAYPGQLCLDNRGLVAVADGANGRVQLFTTGK